MTNSEDEMETDFNRNHLLQRNQCIFIARADKDKQKSENTNAQSDQRRKEKISMCRKNEGKEDDIRLPLTHSHTLPSIVDGEFRITINSASNSAGYLACPHVGVNLDD